MFSRILFYLCVTGLAAHGSKVPLVDQHGDRTATPIVGEPNINEADITKDTETPPNVTVTTGEFGVIQGRYAKHTLTTWEVNHLKRTTKHYNDVKASSWPFNTGPSIDEYDVSIGDEDECVVSIGGTEGKSEWAGNLGGAFEFHTIESVITGHSNFVDSAASLHNDGLQDKIKNICGNRLVLTFTGHSRGGAIASVLAALYYERDYAEYIRLVTWGSPRVLSEKTANRYHLESPEFYQIRVVNGGDPVPAAPGMSMGFRHFGTAVCLDCDDTSQDGGGWANLILYQRHGFAEYNTKISKM
ncbi:hypothetical protein SARC_12766 [Sphaeroforma arctica JP610]|uniref:Fungal lipase-type domain-containing protein n=1 Tax=Sphaeroforma arctica JP610 TaxID=667725 RepID=A0A0L0FF63_9EUKA|nr:hypothetical protein SARC_12766 [Sphaeroforma arctica JP610]KNC74693.1 hypothetical protein SARC_12766 [Sphaeroforma arctica JP610]|eukprot:XP_014148595.1 hypothetical protein SARC_12766 [Sphaeroforma arctica JP610]